MGLKWNLRGMRKREPRALKMFSELKHFARQLFCRDQPLCRDQCATYAQLMRNLCANIAWQVIANACHFVVD